MLWAEGALFVVVAVAFFVALYARHHLLRADPRPGYVHDHDDYDERDSLSDPDTDW